MNTNPDFSTMNIIQLIETAEKLLVHQQSNEAVALYSSWLQSNSTDPKAYAAAFNLGVILKDIGRKVESERAYRLSIELNPDCLEAQFNLGSQLEQLARPDEAIAQWQQLLESGRFQLPRDEKLYLLTLNNLGRLLEILKKYSPAEEYLRRSLDRNPDQPDALQHFIYQRQRQCKWPIYPDLPGVPPFAMTRATGPLSLLAVSNDPQAQFDRARRYAEEKITVPALRLSPERGYDHKKLRVGYFSSDFCLHPVAMLTVELFELHDRSNFEIYGFCWTRDDGSDLRKRVIAAFDHFIIISELSDEQAALTIRSLEIDILVDLHGLTLGSRPGVLAYRPAPVQITYLGFPGTSGLPGVDYVLADRYILPEQTATYFTERPLYLPACFQVSDRKRLVGVTPSRASCGLPDGMFVFCCFNNNYKLTPEVFSVWMRILSRVPQSVLWLLADNQWAEQNLRSNASFAGVNPSRLFFAGRVAPHDYLARYQIADLFLDAFPFGAGTTANDALWQGLPLLTCSGKTFSSRYAGSILTELGVPELITQSMNEYEDLAVALATDPERYMVLRAYLRSRIKHSNLFKTDKKVRDIEDAFRNVAAFSAYKSLGCSI